MDCTKQCTRRISMRIQDYEIFTKLHSASFKTGTENMFPIGKFTTIGLQQHQYLMFKLHSSAHGLFTFLNKVQRFIVYTHLNNKRQHSFQLFQPNFPNPQFWSDSLKSGPKIYFVRQYFQTKEKLWSCRQFKQNIKSILLKTHSTNDELLVKLLNCLKDKSFNLKKLKYIVLFWQGCHNFLYLLAVTAQKFSFSVTIFGFNFLMIYWLLSWTALLIVVITPSSKNVTNS